MACDAFDSMCAGHRILCGRELPLRTPVCASLAFFCKVQKASIKGCFVRRDYARSGDKQECGHKGVACLRPLMALRPNSRPCVSAIRVAGTYLVVPSGEPLPSNPIRRHSPPPWWVQYTQAPTVSSEEP